MKKIIALTLITALLAGIFTGCGRKQDDGIDPDTIAYLPSYIDVDFGNGWIQSMVTIDELVYFFTSEWNESEMINVNKIIKISLLDGTADEINLFPLPENGWVVGMAKNAEGTLVLLVTTWSEDSNDYIMYEVSPEGQKIGETNMGDILGLGDGWLSGMAGDEDGNLYFNVGSMDGRNKLVALSSAGNIIGEVGIDGHIQRMFFIGDDVYVTSWSNSGRGGMVLMKADFATGSFGTEITFDGMSPYGNMSFAAGGETGLLISDSTGLYSADIETGETIKLLDWLESDVYANDVSHFGQLEDGTIWLVNRIYGNQTTTTELIMLAKTTHGKLPPRTTITYAGLYLSGDIKQAIVKFNKTNPKYRIRAIEYIDFTQDFDWATAMTAFNNDLTSGRGADIIDLSMVNFSLLASKGILHDLSSYFNKHINPEDYLANAMSAYDIGGKKFGIMTGFGFSVLAGHKSKLEGIDRWTIDEMIDWAEKFPDSLLMRTNALSIMYSLVYTTLERFIDWNTGTVSFTGDEFIRILEFASTFGNEDLWGDPNQIGTREGLTTGKHLLMECYIHSLEYMQVVHSLFDGEEKYIGYPTESGEGIMFNPSGAAGINARSKNKDGAFEFIMYLLSDDFQSESKNPNRYATPVKQSAIDEFIERVTTPEMEGGIERLVTSWGFDDFHVEIYASKNKEFIDTYIDLISRVDGIRFYDEQVINIIQEETESFFTGQKSARDAAEIIQNRIQLYVNENR